MQIETRIAELRQAIAAGEYAPSPELIAGAILAKLDLIRRARRRIEAGEDASFEAAPPKRRFDPSLSRTSGSPGLADAEEAT
jgi:hypothetical protein